LFSWLIVGNCGLLKSQKQIPRGLKAARDDKKKRLIGTTEESA
jgi:hypothetical protein